MSSTHEMKHSIYWRHYCLEKTRSKLAPSEIICSTANNVFNDTHCPVLQGCALNENLQSTHFNHIVHGLWNIEQSMASHLM